MGNSAKWSLILWSLTTGILAGDGVDDDDGVGGSG